MPDFNFILLHVRDHAASATLYHELLGIPIVDVKPDIAILPLRDGVMLGLWSRETVEPASSRTDRRKRDRLRSRRCGDGGSDTRQNGVSVV